MYNPNVLAQRLKISRVSQKLTQRQLAEKVNITAATISAYEKGAKNPTLQNVMQLSEALNVSIDWLCGTPKFKREALSLLENKKFMKNYPKMKMLLESGKITEDMFDSWLCGVTDENNSL